MISIDLNKCTVDLLVDEETIAKRKANWKAPEPDVKKGSYLDRYAKLVQSAMTGAILKRD